MIGMYNCTIELVARDCCVHDNNIMLTYFSLIAMHLFHVLEKPSTIKLSGCTGVTDNTRGKFIDGLSSTIAESSACALNKYYPECIHISAVRDIVEEEVDTVFSLSANDDFSGK